MKKDKHINIALETETYKRLGELAVEDKRPVSSLARHIIKLYIKGIEDGSIELSIYTMFKKQKTEFHNRFI